MSRQDVTMCEVGSHTVDVILQHREGTPLPPAVAVWVSASVERQDKTFDVDHWRASQRVARSVVGPELAVVL